jgi:hypothetical protein
VNSPNEPKVCCVCDKGPALRKVGKKGFCSAHYDAACREASGAKNVPIRQLLEDAEEPEFAGPGWRAPRGFDESRAGLRGSGLEEGAQAPRSVFDDFALSSRTGSRGGKK